MKGEKFLFVVAHCRNNHAGANRPLAPAIEIVANWLAQE
jgi:hypothetical protein